MIRHSRRSKSRIADRLQTTFEQLEDRVLLACDMRLLDNGTLQITGDSLPQIINIVDRGNGNVNVQCQEPGRPIVSRNFARVAGIVGDLKGGDDVLNYSSVQDVNSSLRSLELLMGDGNDRANLDITMRGTPSQSRGFSFVTKGGSGDDSLVTRINSLTRSNDPTQPVVHGDMEGGAGRDEITLVSNTAAGGFVLAIKEMSPSNSTTSQPGCVLWDLIDGTSGQVDVQVMGTEVDELMTFQTDTRGIGRSNFDISLDGGGGVNVATQIFLITGEWGPAAPASSLAIRNATQVSAEICTIDAIPVARSGSLDLEIIGTEQADTIRIVVGPNCLTNLNVNVDTKGGDDKFFYSHSFTMINGRQLDPSVNIFANVGTGADFVDVSFDFSAAPRMNVGELRVEMQSKGGGDTFRVMTNDAPVIGDSLIQRTESRNNSVEEDCDIYDLIGPGVVGGASNNADVGRFQLVLGQTGTRDPRTGILTPDGAKCYVSAGTVPQESQGLFNLVVSIDDNQGHASFSDMLVYDASLIVTGLTSFHRSMTNVEIANAFSESIEGTAGRDQVVLSADDLKLNSAGRLESRIALGEGDDTVIQSLRGFQNYGSALFGTRLGAGADRYISTTRDLYVAVGGSFAMTVDGGAGGDLILASMQATVDGNYRFVARGGGGNDVIGVVQQLETNWRRNGQAPRPAIDILMEGNDGDDQIGLWVSIANGYEDLVAALVDGGRGNDTAFTRGPVRVVNVENLN